MKARSKDLIVIVVALAAILGCGYGLGIRLAEKSIKVDPPSVAIENFTPVTLSNLSADLGLSPEEESAILPDVQSTSAEIAEARKRALFEYHQRILDLHDKVGARLDLDPERRQKLQNSKKSLQEIIEKRFPVLLDASRAKSGGGSHSSD